MGQIETRPSEEGAGAPAGAESPPVASLAYATTSTESACRMVRGLAGFTVLYAATMLLSRAMSLLAMIYVGNGSIDWAEVFGPPGLLYLGVCAIEAGVLVAMIIAAAQLRSGRDVRRLLVWACWGYIAGSAAVVLVQVGVTLFASWAGPHLPRNSALYWVGQNFVSLLGRVVFPLAVAGILGGKTGEALVREAR